MILSGRREDGGQQLAEDLLARRRRDGPGDEAEGAPEGLGDVAPARARTR
ncbi:MAG TPA: hypothetical protein VFT09_04960 [Ilumatobacteraceae bacterium]|nr:hypothetical protein [Ilumatobacteraceae bacterium]